MTPLRALLADLERRQATGRVTVKGVRPAVVMVDAGRIYLAERSDQPNLLIAMAAAELFSSDEWGLALRLPTKDKWRALVNDDDRRLAELTSFARRYTTEVLTTLVEVDVGTPTFKDRVRHPFGPLASWTIDELVGAEAAPVGDRILEADPYDRREFLEMLAEVSPLVRPQS